MSALQKVRWGPVLLAAALAVLPVGTQADLPAAAPAVLPAASPAVSPVWSPADRQGAQTGEAPALVSALLGVREPVGDRDETAVWGWPLSGQPPIVRGFDPPAQRWLPGHRGIDLGGVEGERVLAVDDGVVSFSGEVAGVGVVSLTHASGLRSTYQPVTDRARRGERVGRGEGIGTLALDGGHCTLRACLHLGAVRGRDGYVDPTPLLLGVDLALKPVER